MEYETPSSNPEQRMSTAKRVILILLTIFIVGPFVFVGSCFPLGAISAIYAIPFVSITGAFVIGIFLAIFVCWIIIKQINKN